MAIGPIGVLGLLAVEHVVQEERGERVTAITLLHPMVGHSVLVKRFN